MAELSEDTYVMLKPSPIAGIGVFAIREIPTGCRALFSKPAADDHWILFTRQEVNALPSHARLLVENYCLYDSTHYFVPEQGFKKLDISLFLNHSETPNVISINEGEYFESTRMIQAGEEICINYGELVEGDY